MRSIKAFIITFAIAILAFSGIAYAETMEYGDYTYDDNGNVTISGYSVSKYDFEDFLEYVGATYSVVSIDLGDEIYDIESEAFSSVQGTLEEINIPIGVGYIGYNAFGEVHNVKINYGGNADYWYGVYKENDDDYYANVEFYADGYASLSGMNINAMPGKIYGEVWFNFVDADCVAEFCVYDYNDNGEKEVVETYTKNISEGTYNGNYEFDFECDGEWHYISVALYDNLTDRTQWGALREEQFYADNSPSRISGFGVDAYKDKIYADVWFNYVEADCVAEFCVYDYNDNGEKEVIETYTKNISAGTDSEYYEFDFESDGEWHYIGITLYNNLTDRIQFGDEHTTEFLADNNSIACHYISPYANNSKLTLQMYFQFITQDCVAFVEIFDYDEDGNLVPNSELVIDISADTVTDTPFSYEIPFKFDNKEHEIKVSFYDNMTSKNELCDWVGSAFYALRAYNDFLYDFIDDETVKITGYSGYGSEISVPQKILNYTVTEIAGSAFSGQSELSVITIPETIRFIAVGAFEDCTNLARVNYWGTEEDWANIIIGSKNENLTNSEIIYNYAPPMYVNWNFGYDGENLDVRMWIDNCFKDCLAKIELFNISKNETTIVYYDIDKGTSGEENISIPLTNYDETFRIYGSIVSTDKTEYITAPYNFAFFTPYEDKESFKEGEFEYFVNSEDEAEIARYCGESSEVVIPDTLGGYPVTKLMGWSLSGVEMTDLTIGKYLKEIGYGALSYCFALENITVNSENDNFLFEDGVLYNADKTEILLYLLTNTAEHFDMPDTVEVVGAHAFEGGEKLKTITVSDNLKKLERQAFAYSVLSGELILPEGVEEIGSEALVCGFTKIHIPSTVTSMAKDAVMGGKDLLEITVAEENENFSSVDGVLYNKDKTILIEYPEAKDSVSFEIPNTVKEIGEAAFIGAENLKKVVIPKSIKLINEGAFYYTPVEEFIYRGTENEFKKVVVAGSSGVYDVSFGAPKIEMVDYSVSEASFEVTGTSEPADIVIAYYKNGIFEKVEKREFVADKVETITLNSTFDYEKDTIKIMVWDSISTQKPICEAVTIGK